MTTLEASAKSKAQLAKRRGRLRKLRPQEAYAKRKKLREERRALIVKRSKEGKRHMSVAMVLSAKKASRMSRMAKRRRKRARRAWEQDQIVLHPNQIKVHKGPKKTLSEVEADRNRLVEPPIISMTWRREAVYDMLDNMVANKQDWRLDEMTVGQIADKLAISNINRKACKKYIYDWLGERGAA